MQKDPLSFYENPRDGNPLTVLSVPLELGSDERGLSAAPRYLLELGLKKMLSSIGREHETRTIFAPDTQPVASAGTMKHAKAIAEVAKRTRSAVERAAKKGNAVLALGGDHSMSIGSLAGATAVYPSLGVIYIDSHPDCHTDETTISGNVHGMVTATAMGKGHPLLTEVMRRTISPEHFLYIGLKDFDSAEMEYLRRERATVFTMLDITRHGLSPVFTAIDSLRRRTEKTWVSMDMDSIDESDAPGVGLAVPDGLTRREVLGIAQYIGKTCPVVGLDIVEMLPAKDKNKKTGMLALALIARFLGSEYSWYQQEYMDVYRETNITNSEEVVRSGRSRKA